MTRAWEADIAAECDAWRAALGTAGFSDDGHTLRGPVRWQHPDGRTVIATIEVTITESFPFSPPKVRILDPGLAIELTFHRERDGSLCLWRSDVDVSDAPWQAPERLLDRVAVWLTNSAAGWPSDDDCDLERYLLPDSQLVLYNRDVLTAISGCVRTFTDPATGRVTISGESQRPPSRWRTSKRQDGRRGRRRQPKIGRKQRRLAWVTDIGQVDKPIYDWDSLCTTLGPDAGEVRRLVSIGVIDFVLLRYRRSSATGVLAMAVRTTSGKARFDVRACESADTSVTTRILRAGASAAKLSDRRVAVVGTGAIGSFVVDLLFRHGVRQFTLIDPQLLRPGNLVRHLAGEALVGYSKVSAVKARLAGLGFDVSGVNTRRDEIVTPDQSMALLRDHDLIIDATASPRTTALLAWAARHVDRPVITVCAQRQGTVVRVDRFPLRGGEQHLSALPPLPGPDLGREHGCDNPVSPTPPAAVVAAAQLACRAAVDELILDCALPATLLDVLAPQEPPFDVIGMRMGSAR
ncbi:ThiF family adenylyltransferase [Nonomuraea purpurea]|uniref:ThiF family adenylyltransferase n=1 Tax=Nonomuraea purpurea TaxID=1849276 RepID=A0ABV8GMI7_9ACTN